MQISNLVAGYVHYKLLNQICFWSRLHSARGNLWTYPITPFFPIFICSPARNKSASKPRANQTFEAWQIAVFMYNFTPGGGKTGGDQVHWSPLEREQLKLDPESHNRSAGPGKQANLEIYENARLCLRVWLYVVCAICDKSSEYLTMDSTLTINFEFKIGI